MAEAKRETVARKVVTEVKEEVVRLDLTEAEARAVLALTRMVAGGRVGSCRKETDDIGEALFGAIGSVNAFDYSRGTLFAKNVNPGDAYC